MKDTAKRLIGIKIQMDGSLEGMTPRKLFRVLLALSKRVTFKHIKDTKAKFLKEKKKDPEGIHHEVVISVNGVEERMTFQQLEKMIS